MPIYEYVCDSCQHEFEEFQKLSDPVLTTCPRCGAEQLRKKISAAGFRLKGGGWYETDFKGSKKKNVAGDSDGGKSSSGDGGSDSSKSAGGSTSSSSKSDSKASGGAAGGSNS